MSKQCLVADTNVQPPSCYLGNTTVEYDISNILICCHGNGIAFAALQTSHLQLNTEHASASPVNDIHDLVFYCVCKSECPHGAIV